MNLSIHAIKINMIRYKLKTIRIIMNYHRITYVGRRIEEVAGVDSFFPSLFQPLVVADLSDCGRYAFFAIVLGLGNSLSISGVNNCIKLIQFLCSWISSCSLRTEELVRDMCEFWCRGVHLTVFNLRLCVWIERNRMNMFH